MPREDEHDGAVADVETAGDDEDGIDGDAALTEESDEAAVMAGTGDPPGIGGKLEKDVQSYNIRCQGGAIILVQ